tara:strand:+ start:1180 stop:1854 length:675 start_codon:yes stop_codon:yes gene_type:complete
MGFFSRVIRSEIPSAFFSAVPETIDAAFAASHRKATVDGRVLPAQRAYALGTDRYFAVQCGVVDAAVALGAEDLTARIGPSGYPMPLVRMGRTIIATCITDSLDHLRRSRARAELATLNSMFEPFQPSFWDDGDAPLLDGFRFAMLLVAKPHRDDQQDLPGGIFFGVPTTSLKSWHFYERVDAVRAQYDEADWAETLPARDRRFPRLKHASHSIEEDDGTGTEG